MKRVGMCTDDLIHQFIGHGFSPFDQTIRSMNDSLSTFANLMVVDRQRALFAANSGLQAAKSSTMLNSSGNLDRSVCLNIYPRNNRFFGRNDVLQTLSEHLLPSMQDTLRLRSFALYGLAGIGKSQIATEFVYRNMRSFKAVFLGLGKQRGEAFPGLYGGCEGAELEQRDNDQRSTSDCSAGQRMVSGNTLVPLFPSLRLHRRDYDTNISI